MNVLVLNGGSSSIKFSVFDTSGEGGVVRLLLDGEIRGLGEPKAELVISRQNLRKTSNVRGAETPAGAIGLVLDAVAQTQGISVDAVGYRVVHPGPRIRDHVCITEEVLQELERAAEFAPLHDPQAVAYIRETMRRMPDVPHVACFDTVFHQTMPEEASTYAIPELYRALGVRRYGFHGLSCESIVRQLSSVGTLPKRMVIAHLGSGCSVTAVLDGQSIDTTMGLTPTGGVLMGTRTGDVDPGLLLYLLRQELCADAADKLETMLNHQSGMVALTGLANDMKAVRRAAEGGDNAAVLALKIFTRSIRKAIGAFAWLLGGLDAIVFTGGIGEHDAATRLEILAGTDISVDSAPNGARGTGVRRISAPDSQTAVFAVTAQEDLVIALHVKRMVPVVV